MDMNQIQIADVANPGSSLVQDEVVTFCYGPSELSFPLSEVKGQTFRDLLTSDEVKAEFNLSRIDNLTIRADDPQPGEPSMRALSAHVTAGEFIINIGTDSKGVN